MRARCDPRLVWATAWISSTITASTPARISRTAAGHHQVERLGGGDQDVGRRFRHRPAVFLRGVAGAQADRDVGADPAQGGAEVALDVVGERFQRRDVDEADAGAEFGRAGEAVDAPEEAGERLAGAGRGADQRVVAARRSPPSRPPGRASAPRRRLRTSAGSPPRTAPAGQSRCVVSIGSPTHRSYAPVSPAFAGPRLMGRKPQLVRFSAHQHEGPRRSRPGAAVRRSCYGVPPVNFVNSVQDFFGTKPFLKRPEPLQKLQVSGGVVDREPVDVLEAEFRPRPLSAA